MHYKNDHSTLKHTLRQARTSPVLFLFLLALIISRSNPSTLPLLSPPRPHEHLEYCNRAMRESGSVHSAR